MSSNINNYIKEKKIDISDFCVGKKQSEVKNSSAQSIFNKIDTNKDGVLNETEYSAVEEQVLAQRAQIRKMAEGLADKFYKIADDNSGNTSMAKMKELLNTSVNEKNIAAFLDAYDREKTRKGDSSIIDTVTSEVTASSEKQKEVLMLILDKLSAAAKKAGVSDKDIQKARKDFTESMNKEMAAKLRRTNPKDMEKAIDFLRGAIAAKTTQNAQKVSTKEAMQTFKQDFKNSTKEAQKQYKDAKGDGWSWTAKTGDTVCGWFGCNTIEDMEKKLGDNAKYAKLLSYAADNNVEKFKEEYKSIYGKNLVVPDNVAKNPEALFKFAYKKVFGIDFDPNKISAYEAAQGNYSQVRNLDNTVKICDEIINESKNNQKLDLKKEIMTKMGYDEDTINQIIENYRVVSGDSLDEREVLMKFLNDVRLNSSRESRKLKNGKTLEQMEKDIGLLQKSAFGTNDIVKDVMQFTENMQTTEMVTDAAFEVAGTIALQFVPGMGQMAAARLAVSAAKWGTKAVKVANWASKSEKIFAAAKKVQDGTKFGSKIAQNTAKIASQMGTAGAATASVEASTGKDAKTVMKKTLMNMSFAGVGAGSSALAPKLMQAFKIDSTLANEIAEEIINAAGSYGVTKIAGDDYGASDAFIDFATGIVMARISHVKTGKIDIQKQNVSLLDIEGNNIAGGFFSRSSNKKIRLREDSGWQNFKTNSGEVTVLVNNDGTVWVGNVGSTTKKIDMKLNERRIIGTGEDGASIILERSGDGSYSVQHMHSQSPNNQIKRNFWGNREISNKSVQQKVNKQISVTKANDPGNCAMSERLKSAIDNPSFVKEFPENTNLIKLSEQTKPGDVCSLGGKLYVNQNGQMMELKMSKQTFERLFPPMGMAVLEQQGYNNCWLVSRLNSMTESSVGRAQLYSMIEEAADGSITVTLPGSKRTVKFPEGKPVNVENTLLGDGASSGVEMIHQSVLISLLKKEAVDDVTKLNLSSLRDEANSLSHSDLDATKLLFGSPILPITSATSNYRQKVIEQLENFKSGQDMGTAAWGAHQRSIVDYNPNTQQIIYHDPYYGYIDITCSLDEFLRQNPALSIKKNTFSEASGTRTVFTEHVPDNTFRAQKTELNAEWKPVTQTAEGKDIFACIQGNNLCINKNGKNTKILLNEIYDGYAIRESSTGNYIVVQKNSSGNISLFVNDVPELPSLPLKVGVPHKIEQPKVQSTGITKSLTIPNGFKENGMIFGKRSIIDRNGVIMIEKNGAWKKIN